jgi:amino acid transporter
MSQGWSDALLFICVVAQFFCVTASTTSASRMMFAFSRDGAVPGNRWWRRISKHRVPVYAVFAIGVMAGLLMVPTIWNYLVGYAVGTAIAVIGLYIAFVLPVFLRLRLGERFERGAWSLGRHYKWIDVIALVWVAVIAVLFSLPLFKNGLPWDADFAWTSANYTVLWFAGFGIFFGGWWLVSARKWFKGPVRMGTEEELAALESQQEGHFLLPADTEFESA